MKIKLLNKIAKCGTAVFDDKYTVGEEIENPDAIMVRSAAMHDMEFGKDLKAIARAGAASTTFPLTDVLTSVSLFSTLPALTQTLLKSL